ncbi:MAG: hypothetical protein WA322_11670 [Pseudolabrys sp.]
MSACSASSGDIISPGSAISGGGGSIFADSPTSAVASSAGLSRKFFREDSLIDDVLSEGFPDFIAGLNLEMSFEVLTDSLVSEDLVLDELLSVDFVVVRSDDCAFELVLTVGFLFGDLARPMA